MVVYTVTTISSHTSSSKALRFGPLLDRSGLTFADVIWTVLQRRNIRDYKFTSRAEPAFSAVFWLLHAVPLG